MKYSDLTKLLLGVLSVIAVWKPVLAVDLELDAAHSSSSVNLGTSAQAGPVTDADAWQSSALSFASPSLGSSASYDPYPYLPDFHFVIATTVASVRRDVSVTPVLVSGAAGVSVNEANSSAGGVGGVEYGSGSSDVSLVSTVALRWTIVTNSPSEAADTPVECSFSGTFATSLINASDSGSVTISNCRFGVGDRSWGPYAWSLDLVTGAVSGNLPPDPPHPVTVAAHAGEQVWMSWSIIRSSHTTRRNSGGACGLWLDCNVIPSISNPLFQLPDPDGYPKDSLDSNTQKGDPVNLVTGNMHINATDLATPGPGMAFQFTRTYNSKSWLYGPLGHGWAHNLGVALYPLPGTNMPALLQGGDGDQMFFLQATPGVFIPPPGEHSQLSTNASGFAWQTKDKITYNFNVTGQLQSVTDRNGNAITLSHDAAGRLTSATDTAGRTYSFVYDTHGHLVSLAAPGGRTVTYAYDANDNLIRVVGPAGGVTTYEYLDPADSHNITRQTVDGHFVMDYTYDAMDRCSRSQGQGGGFGVSLEYHPELSYTRVTDARGNLQTCYYNSKGTIDRIVYPGGTQEQFVWSADVNRTAATTRDGRNWTYQYDGRANLTRINDPLLNTVLLAYDNQDNLTSLTDERGKQTRYAYDGKGNPTRIDYADGTWETFTYNARGQPLTAADSKSNTVAFAYDTSGNLLSVTDPNGNRVSNTYDALGRRTAQTDARGNKTSYAFDALNRVTRITNALSAKVNLTHTTAGLGSLTDPNSNTTQFRYNALNLLEETTDALGNKKTFTYDGNGNLASRTNFNGASTTYSYDALDQLSGISYPNASSVGFQYDNAGRMTQMTDATGISRYAYDSLGRLAAYTNGSAQTVNYNYDAAGNLVSLTYPGDKTVSYSYDDRGRLVQVADWAYRLTTYQYDDLGRLVLVTLPNGTKAEYKYDNAGRVTELRNLRADGSAIATYVYTLDGNGNIVAEDADEPLQPVQSAETNSYVIGADNRLLSAGGTPLAYDKNGNLASNGATTYEYDYENRLTRVAIPGQGIWDYLYDGAGRRLRVTHGSEVRRFLVDPRGMTQVLAEYDGAGTLVCQYVYGMGLLYKIDASGNAYYYHYNLAGHTVAMTDAAGTIVNKYAYLPFGEPAGCQETVPNPFRYVGQHGVMDDGNGLHYMRARYYHCDISRFLTKDPIGFFGGINLYCYVKSNPVNLRDPAGLSDEDFSLPEPYVLEWINSGAMERGMTLKEWYQRTAKYHVQAQNDFVRETGKALIKSCWEAWGIVDIPHNIWQFLKGVGEDWVVGRLLHPRPIRDTYPASVLDDGSQGNRNCKGN